MSLGLAARQVIKGQLAPMAQLVNRVSKGKTVVLDHKDLKENREPLVSKVYKVSLVRPVNGDLMDLQEQMDYKVLLVNRDRLVARDQ
jgi:hypothetical protein